jgi:transposase-like protein
MMQLPPDPHYCRRFPAEVISYCVWLHYVFNLSFRGVELLLAERGAPKRTPRPCSEDVKPGLLTYAPW